MCVPGFAMSCLPFLPALGSQWEVQPLTLSLVTQDLEFNCACQDQRRCLDSQQGPATCRGAMW